MNVVECSERTFLSCLEQVYAGDVLGDTLTSSDQYLKITFPHLARARKSAITSLFDRAKNIISNPSDQEKRENHLTAVLQANGYLKKFSNDTIRASKLPRQLANNDNTENQEQIAQVRVNLPHVKGTSEQLKGIFNDMT